ncbi:hypothetical protein PPL_05387 [Heterostelium album PN500]|uniref:Uncharacterized protein n=1 Tax=Heterostelium pallidum (strain ATCC 26659 / Pp 5 / PN500) TaxID=670386 RepID=D3BA15_HETP5|nr:hypothetical protein PPL_05387 [Heterostelium album PN500]EFA81402.1 hypothetical protein PPL_05387 [Heterostelium album PN500]|eukprot:XP_020433520.1 hypothetical protein PPL_05387 [Heterostelium album PN500]
MNEYRCPSREDWVILAYIFSLEKSLMIKSTSVELCLYEDASSMELYKKSVNADGFYRYPNEREVSIFKKIYSDSQQAIESLDIVDASVDEDDGDDDERTPTTF